MTLRVPLRTLHFTFLHYFLYLYLAGRLAIEHRKDVTLPPRLWLMRRLESPLMVQWAFALISIIKCQCHQKTKERKLLNDRSPVWDMASVTQSKPSPRPGCALITASSSIDDLNFELPAFSKSKHAG